MNSDWLGNKLHSRVKENPDLKLAKIMERANEKWGIGVNFTKAYRARSKAFDLVDGSFREQYTRLYDYAHESFLLTITVFTSVPATDRIITCLLLTITLYWCSIQSYFFTNIFIILYQITQHFKQQLQFKSYFKTTI